MERKAYVTLLSTENYLDAVLVLNKSLKEVKSKYPLLVMITDMIVSKKLIHILEKNDILFSIIPTLNYSNKTEKKFKGHTVLNTASKLNIFKLKEWDKLVYIDADSIVLKNIDILFDYPDGAMLWDSYDEQGFSGLFVISPKYHEEYDFYLTLIKNQDCFDGDLLGKMWFFVKSNTNYQIPYQYFSQYDKDNNEANVFAIHFCNELKPWINLDHQYFQDNKICDIYKKYLKEVCQNNIN